VDENVRRTLARAGKPAEHLLRYPLEVALQRLDLARGPGCIALPKSKKERAPLLRRLSAI
jgi:hypothetical protein